MLSFNIQTIIKIVDERFWSISQKSMMTECCVFKRVGHYDSPKPTTFSIPKFETKELLVAPILTHPLSNNWRQWVGSHVENVMQ